MNSLIQHLPYEPSSHWKRESDISDVKNAGVRAEMPQQ